jgi:hypothetical protein
MITERDKEIIRFIERVGVASTGQVERMFFSEQKHPGVKARERLRAIVAAGKLKRDRLYPGGQYFHFIKRPGLPEHSLLITDFYIALSKMPGRIEVWELEPQFDHCRPDAFCEYVRGRWHYLLCVEAERMTGNPLNQGKYEAFLAAGKWRDRWPQFPRVVVLTDKRVNVKPTEIRFIIVPTSLEGLDKIFKEG